VLKPFEQPWRGLHERDVKGDGWPGQFAGHLGEGPGRLHAGGAAAGDNDVDRRGGGTGRGLLERAQQVPAQPHRVGQRVQRPSVFARARDAEEVRLGTGGHDQVVKPSMEPSWSTSARPG